MLQRVIKVESHIEASQAPDKFFWKCNDRENSLITKARESFTVVDLRKRKVVVFDGIRAVYSINGQQVNNGMHNV